MLSFINDQPARQTLTVDPKSGKPIAFPRYFGVFEAGLFAQDDWKFNQRVNLNLGIRWDYLGDAKERDGILSLIISGGGSSFREQIATAAVGRIKRLYKPELTNFSPRVGIALSLEKGEYIFGYQRLNAETLRVTFYQAKDGELVGALKAKVEQKKGAIYSLLIEPPTAKKGKIYIGRFTFEYVLG